VIAYLRRLLCVLLGVVSPSVLATLRRREPPPRSWLARRERALALRALGDRLSIAERADRDAGQVLGYLEAVTTIADKDGH
jgi:hypothetical protein